MNPGRSYGYVVGVRKKNLTEYGVFPGAAGATVTVPPFSTDGSVTSAVKLAAKQQIGSHAAAIIM